jgi:transmembrane sensor
MTQSDADGTDTVTSRDETAASAFLRRRAGEGLALPPPEGMSRVERVWQAVGDHASAPELIAMRTQALARLRRANAHRWLDDGAGGGRRGWTRAAALVVATLLLGVAWQLSPYGYAPGRYETGTGEQRVLDLEDGSRVALDAQTRIRVRYTDDVRMIQLTEGQAQFSVAHDPQRPFRVQAGGHTIVALGTTFSVEYVDEQVRVAMIEGRVLVTVVKAGEPEAPSGSPDTGAGRATELTAGEGLRVRDDGETTFIPNANVAAATAWRQGKVIFDSEPLSEAARRLNRYSRLQVVIDDPQLAQLSVSGIFEVGDSREFVHVMESYLRLEADYSEPGIVRLNRPR